MPLASLPPSTVGVQGYTTRRLPVEEWERLRAYPFATHGLPNPDLTLILVAEDATGTIVGIWAAMTAVHLDGLWVHPDHQGTTIAGRLLKGMKALLRQYGLWITFTVIQDAQVMVLAHKAGFVRATGDLWILQIPQILPDSPAPSATDEEI